MSTRINMSRNTKVVAFMLLMLVASVAFNSVTVSKAEILDADYVIQTSVTFSNNGTTLWNLTEEDREISLFMNNSWQTVYLTESSCSIEMKEPDEDGNLIAILQFPESQLEPGHSVNYTLAYSVQSRRRSIPHLNEQESENLTEIPSSLKEKYCIESDTWQINDPTLQETAHTIAGNETNVLSIVEEFVAWIWNSIDYPPQDKPKISHEVPLYPNQTLLHRQGDCDDQAILFITFCRILGIPSFLQVGCIYGQEFTDQQSSWNGTVTSVLKHIAWHGWAMVYVPPWGWLPVDLTYVMGGRGVPLNAITTAAVTSTKTIQYMNISQREHLASSRKYRDLLIENQFHIYQQDEMNRASQNFFEEFVERWILWILVGAGVIIGALIVVFGYVLKAERRRFEESNKRDEETSFPGRYRRKSLFCFRLLANQLVCRKLINEQTSEPEKR